jgi:predicted nuclease of predicted toxin-antitoxin system
MRFFFDNNIAPKLARGFNQFVAGEHEVIHLRDRFAANTLDVDWMRALAGESGLVILSGDVAIGRNPHEIAAWKTAGHTIFFLKAGWTNIEFWQQVQKLAKCFSEIIDRAQRARPGDSFLVNVNGKIE